MMQSEIPHVHLILGGLGASAVPHEVRGERIHMDGARDSAHRHRIGTTAPRKGAKAMGQVIGQAILLPRAGESFQLSSSPIWVRPIVTALAVRGGERA